MIRGILMTGSLLRGHAGLLKHAAGKAFPRAARQLSTQQVAKGGRGRVLSALGLAAAGGGIFLAVDDSRLTMGIKRSLVFWVQAFPMYLHYRYVEEVTRGKTDAEIDAAYNVLHDRYAPLAVSLCINLGGYFYKAAQIVSTRDEFVPPQYMRELKRLQANAPPQRGPQEVKELVESSLGRPLGEIFASFDLDTPLGAASIGQVHRARLLNGEEVAVKVKYPRVEDYFRSDMKIIKDFCSLAMRQHLPALREIEKQFMSEFDFRREAASMARVANMLNMHPKWGRRVHVPEPDIPLCTSDVLVMELLPGELLEEGIRRSLRAVAASQGKTPEAVEAEHKRRIMERGLRATTQEDILLRAYTITAFALDCVRNAPTLALNLILAPLGIASRREYAWTPVPVNLAATLQVLLQVHAFEVLQGGCFNGDPHPGNVMLMPDGRLGLIDYGSCVDITLSDRIKLARLIVALAKGTPERVAQISMHELGVVTKSQLPEIHYRSAAFWYDRDTPDVTMGMNVHRFLEYLHETDPVVHLPDEFVMVGRISVLLRGMGAAFGLHVSVAKEWRAAAEDLLRSQGLSEGGVAL